MTMTIRPAAPLDADAALPLPLLMQHLKDPADEAETVEAARYGALNWIEQHVGRSLSLRQWKTYWTAVPIPCGALRLPMGPVSAVTAVSYDDPAQIWPSTSYRLSGDDLTTASGLRWNTAFAGLPFAVEYVAGYADLGGEAPALRSAALILAGHLFRNREENSTAVLASMPFGVRMLCEPYRQPVMA